MSWSQQEQRISEQSRQYRDNGESWSGQAQAWMFCLILLLGDAQ
jgi:hypothetical protein